MIEYFNRVPMGCHFYVENDDGTYNLCFKVLDTQGFESYLMMEGSVQTEFASPSMLVIV